MLNMWRWWPRPGRDLSAFADGELRDAAADQAAERIVFDDAARLELARMKRLDGLLAEALTAPGPALDADGVADAVLAQIAEPPVGSAVACAAPQRNWTPTVVASVASVGLLVTAGVALAGLKRRGRL